MALRHFLIAAASLTVLWSHASAPSPSAEELDEQKLIKGTVEIFNDAEKTAGTGFLITERGHILTAEHVIGKSGKTVKVKLDDQEKPVNATVLSSSERFDLALLLIIPEQRLPTIPIGDSSSIKRTDNLWIIGHPAGYGPKPKRRLVTLPVMDVDERGVIWVNGDLRPGNSGGPAINSKGEVIGIVLKKKEDATEASILPVLFARHFLESCGIWISQGRVATYGSELEGINKQLATYKAMHTFLNTDLKWNAEIVAEREVDPTRSKNSEVETSLRISYEKRFPEQFEPNEADVKLFPVASGGFDKAKASDNGLYVSRSINLQRRDTVVIRDLVSSIKGVIGDYNKKAKPTVPLNSEDVSTIIVEIAPRSDDKNFSKASLSIPYRGGK